MTADQQKYQVCGDQSRQDRCHPAPIFQGFEGKEGKERVMNEIKYRELHKTEAVGIKQAVTGYI